MVFAFSAPVRKWALCVFLKKKQPLSGVCVFTIQAHCYSRDNHGILRESVTL